MALTTRNPALDGVRGLAVLAVAGFHLYYFAGAARHAPDWAAWLGHGFLGVNVFFVLSGFLLIRPWLDACANGRPPPPARAFYRRSWQRLAPALYVHWLVVLFALAPLVHGVGILASGHGWLNGFAHLLFLQQLHPASATGLGISTALWTLSLEAQFYLLVPLLAPLFAGRRTLGMVLGALLVSLAWRGFASRYGADLGAWLEPERFIYHLPLSAAPVGYTPALFAIYLEQQLPAYLFDFAAGMALAAWSRRWNLGGATATTVGWTAVLVMVMVVALLRPGIPGDDPWRFLGAPLFALAAAGLIAAAHRSGRLLTPGLSLRALTGLGRMSYSVYLWHTTVLYLLAWLLAAWGLTIVNPFFDLILIALPAILLLASVSYRWLERPMLRRRWQSDPAQV